MTTMPNRERGGAGSAPFPPHFWVSITHRIVSWVWLSHLLESGSLLFVLAATMHLFTDSSLLLACPASHPLHVSTRRMPLSEHWNPSPRSHLKTASLENIPQILARWTISLPRPYLLYLNYPRMSVQVCRV